MPAAQPGCGGGNFDGNLGSIALTRIGSPERNPRPPNPEALNESKSRRISNHALTHMFQNWGGEPHAKKTGPFLSRKRLEYKMPGSFRCLLAVAVVLSHLIHTPYYLHLGYYAVRAFFVLSGFAMTAALHEVYGFDGKRFWINRFLRLVPPYLTVCFLTALAIRCYPLEAARFLPLWVGPATAADIAKNLGIIPQAFDGLKFRYIPPAWSLAVEIIMYAILWLGMARSARGAFICFATGVAYHCCKLFTGAPFAERYFSLESALLSFGTGALIYFWRGRSTLHTRADFALFVSLAWLINFFSPRARSCQTAMQNRRDFTSMSHWRRLSSVRNRRCGRDRSRGASTPFLAI